MNMKNVKVMGYGLWVMVALIVSAPAPAQQAQEWQSTSTMQMSGSNYSAQVGAIGATTVSDMATTTSSSPSRIAGRNRTDYGDNPEVGEQDEDNSPIGDALIPLLLCALAFCGVIAFRRRGKAMTD
jgi:hypothetical protein